MVHPYPGILLSKENELSPYTCKEWVNLKCTWLSEKSQIQNTTFCIFPLVRNPCKRYRDNRNQRSAFRMGGKGTKGTKGPERTFAVIEILSILIMVTVIHSLFTWQTQRNKHFNRANIAKSYLNKAQRINNIKYISVI